MAATRSVLLRVFRRVIATFFREVEIVGAPPKETRGRLFGANHVNGIVDPLLVLTSAPFPIAPVAKAPLFRVPVLRSLLRIADAVPIVRKQDVRDAPDAQPGAAGNEAAFDDVGRHLAAGGNLLIFPEGVSHSEPHVVPIKTGAARMLARAYALGGRGLELQAVALEFDERETFRSRALVLFGPVRAVDPYFEARDAGDARDARDARDERAGVTELTAQLAADLRALVVEGATWDEKLLVSRVAAMLAHEAGTASLASWNEIGRQVAAAAAVLGRPSRALGALGTDGEPGVVAEVATSVGAYHEALSDAGVTDLDVVRGMGGALAGADRAARLVRASGALLALPLALVGTALYLIPYQLPRLATRLAKGERDVVATYKLGIGLVAYPLWTLALLVAAALATHGLLRACALAVVLVSPLCALVWLDRLDAHRRAPRAWRASRREVESLAQLRARAREAIERARDAAA
jgi:hypothetical protein